MNQTKEALANAEGVNKDLKESHNVLLKEKTEEYEGKIKKQEEELQSSENKLKKAIEEIASLKDNLTKTTNEFDKLIYRKLIFSVIFLNNYHSLRNPSYNLGTIV